MHTHSDYKNEAAAVLKEYTNLSNKIVIENSLESIRNVVESTNIPSIDRDIIEKSINNLKVAIQSEPSHLHQKESIESRVTPIYAEEEKVLAALGLGNKSVKEPELYNQSFSRDMERNIDIGINH